MVYLLLFQFQLKSIIAVVYLYSPLSFFLNKFILCTSGDYYFDIVMKPFMKMLKKLALQ